MTTYATEEEGPSFSRSFIEKIKYPSTLRGIPCICLQCNKQHGMIICDVFDNQKVHDWLSRWTDTLCYECSEKIKDKMTLEYSFVEEKQVKEK